MKGFGLFRNSRVFCFPQNLSNERRRNPLVIFFHPPLCTIEQTETFHDFVVHECVLECGLAAFDTFVAFFLFGLWAETHHVFFTLDLEGFLHDADLVSPWVCILLFKEVCNLGESVSRTFFDLVFLLQQFFKFFLTSLPILPCREKFFLNSCLHCFAFLPAILKPLPCKCRVRMVSSPRSPTATNDNIHEGQSLCYRSFRSRLRRE